MIDERNIAYERWNMFRIAEKRQIFRNSRIKITKEEYYQDRISTALSSKKKWTKFREIVLSDKRAWDEGKIYPSA